MVVELGTGASTPVVRSPSTNREVLLAGLSPSQTLFFRVAARTNSGDFRSGLRTLRTAGELILDNPAAAFSGSWTAGTSATDKYGTNYHCAGTAAGSATARYGRLGAAGVKLTR